MIGLNKIWLNQVQLNRLYLNAPFPVYRKMTGGGSSGDGFPVLPGDVTRWHFGGLTNEMMAAMDDPRIEDADGKGRFLSFKNFLWAGMSGVGGYSDEIVQTTFKFTSDKYNMVAIKSGFKHMNFMFKVTGLQPGNKLTLMYAGDSSSVTIYGNWTNDGIYVVNTDIKNIGKPVYFYNGYSAVRGTFIIEILPLYPGFILGDGVDDFAVTEKELNFEDTYTVYTAFIPFQDDPARTMSLCGKDRLKDFYMYYSSLDSIGFFSVDKSVSVLLSNGFNLIVCKKASDKMLIKNLITGKVAEVSVDDLIYNPGLYYLWRSATIANYSKTAIAGQIIDNGHFSTDEEDEKVLNWHKKQYSWLFPDQAWTVTGKTNEDTDRATIANITGNGNNLVLSNFGFAGNSGYGLYNIQKFTNWVYVTERGDIVKNGYSVTIKSKITEYEGYLVTDGVDDKIQSSAFTMGKDFTVVGEWAIIDEIDSRAGISKDFSLGILGKQNGLWLLINDPSNSIVIETKSLKAICSDGRVYLNDWIEVVSSAKQRDPGSNNSMSIGFKNNDFTQMVFKNLAIYPTVLSKEDCIKAYNYLQTLKAK